MQYLQPFIGVYALVFGITSIQLIKTFKKVKKEAKLKNEQTLDDIFKAHKIEINNQVVSVKKFNAYSDHYLVELNVPPGITVSQLNTCLESVETSFYTKGAYVKQKPTSTLLFIPKSEVKLSFEHECNDLFRVIGLKNNRDEYVTVAQVKKEPSRTVLTLNVPKGILKEELKKANEYLIEMGDFKHCQLSQKESLYVVELS